MHILDIAIGSNQNLLPNILENRQSVSFIQLTNFLKKFLAPTPSLFFQDTKINVHKRKNQRFKYWVVILLSTFNLRPVLIKQNIIKLLVCEFHCSFLAVKVCERKFLWRNYTNSIKENGCLDNFWRSWISTQGLYNF